MIFRLVFVLVLICAFPAFSQTLEDSLKLELNNADTDESRITVYSKYIQKFNETKQPRRAVDTGMQLYELLTTPSSSEDYCKLTSNMGTAYINLGMFDSAMFYFDKAHAIAIDQNYTQIIAKIYIGMANVLGRKGKYDSSIIVLEKALPYTIENNNKREQAIIFNNLGNRYGSTGSYSKALSNQMQALNIYEELGNEKRRGRITLIAIGNTYNHMNDYPSAIEYYSKALEGEGSELLEDHFHAVVSNNIGSLKVETGDYKGAISHLGIALSIWGRDSANCYSTYPMMALGQAYVELESMDSANHFAQRALEKSQKCGIPYVTAVSKYVLGRVYLKKSLYKTGLSMLTDALRIASESGRRDVERDVSNVLSRYYYDKGLYKKSFDFLEKYHALSDSLLNEEKLKEIAVVESRFEFDKEKKELEYKHREEILIQEAEVQDQKRIVFGSVLSGVLLLVILFLINRNRVNAVRTNSLLKNKNDEIKRQKDDLEQLNRVKSKLLSVLSHDLKGPIFAIQNTLLLFERDRLNEEELKERTQNLNVQLRGTSFFMDNLLRWAQSELNDLKPKFSDTNIYEVVEETINLLDPISKEKGVSLNNNCSKELMAYVDSDMMKVVIRNLVANAIKYCNDGDRVEVSAEASENEVDIDVVDSGVGMDEKLIQSIFNSSGLTTLGTRKEVGTGLGLTICKEFIELNNGMVEVSSELGVGSKFSIRFRKDS